jgi:tetratricopeptide (TPR) repeat protein
MGKPETRGSAQDAATRAFEAGLEHERAGDRAGAAALYREALVHYPAFPDACRNLAGLLAAEGGRAAATAWLRRALAYAPDDATLHARLADQLRLGFDHQAAEAHVRRALELEPSSLEAWFDLGLLHADRAEDRDAIRCFERVLALAERQHPLALASRWHRGTAYLALGDYPRGLADCEVRYEIAGRCPDLPMPMWRAEPLLGRSILVWSDQGYGDIIQFARFVPALAARGARTILAAPPELLPLLRRFQGVGVLVSSSEPPPRADLQVPLVSLPERLGTSLATLPPPLSYGEARPRDGAHWIERAPTTQLAVGINWAGAPSHPQDYKRSASLAPFLALAELPGVALYSLQKGPAAAELAGLSTQGLIVDLGARLGDFADTADAIVDLDLLVSVDSAAVHVAGALGRPALVLLPYAADWRWLRERDDSPWYPSLRLLRQRAPGDWHSVIAEARRAIAQRPPGRVP